MRPEWLDAVRRGDVRLLSQLLESGADVNARDHYGQTALMRAACTGPPEVVRLLLDGGAELDHTAKYGLSALMLAVVNGRADIVRMLVQAGARQDLRGTGAPGFADKTARDLATARGDGEIVSALQV